jgi:hypothetical protein
MRLIHRRKLKIGEDKYVYPPAEAIVLIKRASARYQRIEGLAELRRELMINLDHFVWQEIERGEWLLIKPEARYFDWKHFEGEARHRRVMAAVENPPPQPKPLVLMFRATDSETAERMTGRKYIASLDGAEESRKIDDQGIGHVPLPSKRVKVSMCLVGS